MVDQVRVSRDATDTSCKGGGGHGLEWGDATQEGSYGGQERRGAAVAPRKGGGAVGLDWRESAEGCYCLERRDGTHKRRKGGGPGWHGLKSGDTAQEGSYGDQERKGGGAVGLDWGNSAEEGCYYLERRGAASAGGHGLDAADEDYDGIERRIATADACPKGQDGPAHREDALE